MTTSGRTVVRWKRAADEATRRTAALFHAAIIFGVEPGATKPQREQARAMLIRAEELYHVLLSRDPDDIDAQRGLIRTNIGLGMLDE